VQSHVRNGARGAVKVWNRAQLRSVVTDEAYNTRFNIRDFLVSTQYIGW
jgi:hypothetical protein